MSSDNDIKDLVTCTICDNTMREPLALKCLHSFCKDCLYRLTSKDYVRCPDCKESTYFSETRHDFKTEKLVDFYRKLRERQSMTASSKDDASGKCDLCDRKGIKSHCTVCEEYLCAECVLSHKNSKASRGHKLVTNDGVMKSLKGQVKVIINKLKTDLADLQATSTAVEASINSIKADHAQQTAKVDSEMKRLVKNIEGRTESIRNEMTSKTNCLIKSLKTSNNLFDVEKRKLTTYMESLQKLNTGKNAKALGDLIQVLESRPGNSSTSTAMSPAFDTVFSILRRRRLSNIQTSSIGIRARSPSVSPSLSPSPCRKRSDSTSSSGSSDDQEKQRTIKRPRLGKKPIGWLTFT